MNIEPPPDWAATTSMLGAHTSDQDRRESRYDCFLSAESLLEDLTQFKVEQQRSLVAPGRRQKGEDQHALLCEACSAWFSQQYNLTFSASLLPKPMQLAPAHSMFHKLLREHVEESGA